MGDLSWGGQAITAMEENNFKALPMIFRARGAHVDTTVRGGCYGRLALPRRGYNPRKMGISAKTYETGDTLLHIAARNMAEPRRARAPLRPLAPAPPRRRDAAAPLLGS